MNFKALVVFSGGMDSTLCLHLAIKKWGKDQVCALSFSYHQLHSQEILQAQKIAGEWGVFHKVIPLDSLKDLTPSALMDSHREIKDKEDHHPPTTLVVGRNGLMVRLSAIYGYDKGVEELYTGVMELEEANSGYRDCSRLYMDLMEKILRIDLGTDNFRILTPLVGNTKKDNMLLAYEEGILPYLMENTLTCYRGLMRKGCGSCPACILRNEGILAFEKDKPHVTLPYSFLPELNKKACLFSK